MSAEFEIDKKKMSPIREASREVSYSRDYVTRLAREGKITASLSGRQWFVDLESLKNFANQTQIAAQLRKVRLSEERKMEQIFYKEKERQAVLKNEQLPLVRRKAMFAAMIVLGLGLISGVVGQSVAVTQLASVSDYDQDFQNYHSVANANAASDEVVWVETDVPVAPLHFTDRVVTDLESGQNGVLLIPSEMTFDPASVFSDEVDIRTASTGVQSAVLVNQNDPKIEKIIPFVIVPVKTAQN